MMIYHTYLKTLALILNTKQTQLKPLNRFGWYDTRVRQSNITLITPLFASVVDKDIPTNTTLKQKKNNIYSYLHSSSAVTSYLKRNKKIKERKATEPGKRLHKHKYLFEDGTLNDL